ncbi:hypothetical protein [Sphingobacterium kitahiroshimense]|uniref:Uncharacterized protein n=1 Tax=Sphingobacterium kitahiroshimense TaxID=470446 RepID=A0ABV0BU02_9SPHI
MKSSYLIMYPKGMEVDVHYPDFTWLCIASFAFGGVCWYLGYLGAAASWLENSSVVVSYLFYVLIVFLAFFYIRAMIIILDKKQNWLLNPEKRAVKQIFLCCLLPTVFLFGVIRPVAIPKDEWLWLPLLVIFGGILLFNIWYSVYFFVAIYHKRKHHIYELKRTVLQQNLTISDLEKQVVFLSSIENETEEITEVEAAEKETDLTEEIDLSRIKSIDPEQEEFLLNNRFLTQKIMYSQIGLFVFENNNNTPMVKLYLKADMGDSIGCEQRSLNEVVRDTNGFVQKIGRYHAVAADMIQSCNLLKGGRLRIVLKVPFEGKVDFEISAKIARRIKGWVMLQVPIEKE